jgi:DNA processing protein
VSGMRALGRGAAGYPARLMPLADLPSRLWVRTAGTAGEDLDALWARPAAAIVGTRAASPAGIELARGLGWDLARRGVLIVSGMARGIDAAAHEGALLAGGRTAAVLACGLDDCYPPEHADLARRIAAAGALLSEWPPGEAPLGWRFPRRNRLISGLADVVVVVEGGARSGARHTAQYALEQGREVMAVPRDPLLPGSVLPNRLLRDGAAPAIGAGEVLAVLGGQPEPRRRRAPAPSGADPEAGPAAAGVSRLLRRRGPLSAEDLTCALVGIAPARVMAALGTLEIQGRVARDPGGRFRACGE